MNNPSGAKTKAIIYVRVSTEKQGESGLGLEAQRAACIKYAGYEGIDVVEIIEDVESASSLDRPGLQRALDALKSGQANAIVVAKLDRLTRDTLDGEQLVRDWFTNRSDFLLLGASESIRTKSAMDRHMLRIQLSQSQYEREVISERTVAALAVKKTQLAAEGKQLGAAPIEQKVPQAVKIILELARQGLSQDKIAEHLNANAVPSANGGVWRQNTVQKVISRNKNKVLGENT